MELSSAGKQKNTRPSPLPFSTFNSHSMERRHFNDKLFHYLEHYQQPKRIDLKRKLLSVTVKNFNINFCVLQ